MKKKLLSILAITSLFTMSACVYNPGSKVETDSQKIYELAKEGGYTGSYYDWLAYIDRVSKANGNIIELGIIDGVINYRFLGEENWKPIHSIDDIVGPNEGNNPSSNIPSSSEDIKPESSEEILPDTSSPVVPDSSLEPSLPDSSSEPSLPDSSSPVIPDSSSEPVLPDSSSPIIPDSSSEPVLPDSSSEPVLPESSLEPSLPDSSIESSTPESTTITEFPEVVDQNIKAIYKVNISPYHDTFKVEFNDDISRYFVLTHLDEDETRIIALKDEKGECLDILEEINGNIYIEGYDTQVKLYDLTTILPDSTKNEISAYQAYCKKYAYKDDELTWVNDLINDKLDDKLNKHNVTFYNKEENSINTIPVIDNNYVIPPEVPALAGYRFNGWEDQETGKIIDFSTTPITKSMLVRTSYSRYYNITFELVPGEIYKEYRICFGDTITLPTVDDPKFKGWYIDDEPLAEGSIFKFEHDVIVSTKLTNVDYTYNTYSGEYMETYNPFTANTEGEKEILSYISNDFFEYDYKFDQYGDPIPGQFEIDYGACIGIEDVTKNYFNDPKYSIPSNAQSNYAYSFKIRNDLMWDDGQAITARDFEYSLFQLLDPKFNNVNRDSITNGQLIIHNAKNFMLSNTQSWCSANDPYLIYTSDLDDKLIFSLGSPAENAPSQGVEEDAAAICEIRKQLASMGLPVTASAADAAGALVASFPELASLTPEKILALEGKTFAQIKAKAELKATWDVLINWWQTEPNEELHFFVTNYQYPNTAWDDVGFKVINDYEFEIILDKELPLLNYDGTPNFKAVYNLPTFPLIKRDLYESCKIAPQTYGGYWTSSYNTSPSTSASWGPYKIVSFVPGREYVLERNDNWYGYKLDSNIGLYQADRIVCKTIREWNTAWLAFQKGEIDEVPIDVSVAKDYKASSQAVYTPSDFVGSLQLQSSMEALKARESVGVNKSILAYKDFRKAISLGFDRQEFTAKCTTSSKPGLGLFNSMHYYDVENGGVYRETDYAKQVLLDIYNVDSSDYNDLDEACNSITGFDPVQAKALVNKAYDAALQNGDIRENDKVVLTFGSGAETEPIMRQYQFIKNTLIQLVKGTKLEGRLDVEFENHNEKWANDFRAGAYDICFGGWSGAAWDPGYFLLAYLSPDYMYSSAWETDQQILRLTIPDVGETGNGITETMSLMDWYNCLNGNPGAKYNWAEGVAPVGARLTIIAALEKEILDMAYTIPLQNSYEASLISFKTEFITRDYNTFMGYGGIKYMKFNYTDAQWNRYCIENSLDYKS